MLQVLRKQRLSCANKTAMKNKTRKLLTDKSKTVPILSFPCVQPLGTTVMELVCSAELQAKSIAFIAERYNTGASLSIMDLSVEAEAFGAKVRFSDSDVPTVEKGIIEDIADAKSITVPEIGASRTQTCIDAIKLAKQTVTDKPVLCSVIGPYSLAGRLFDMTELMIECFDSPDCVEILLSKASEFITRYIKAFKDAGADGVIMAEPAAGLLSPALAEEFSMPFVKRIFKEINSDDFIIGYHNCGNAANDMLGMIAELGADIIHLGNAISMEKALEVLPEDIIVMGNVNPVLFRTGTPDEIKAAVQNVFDECSAYDNFMISTGCDVPAASPWDNINAYFEKTNELYM